MEVNRGAISATVLTLVLYGAFFALKVDHTAPARLASREQILQALILHKAILFSVANIFMRMWTFVAIENAFCIILTNITSFLKWLVLDCRGAEIDHPI